MNAKSAIAAALNCSADCKPDMTRSEQKYQAIVEAAENVFIQLGYQKTSMDKIARQANVSKRTVYNHFTNKDELFHHILRECINELIVTTDIPYQPGQPLDQQLFAFLESKWNIYASERIVKLSRVVIAEYVTTPKFIESFIEEIQEKGTGLERWLQAAADDGRLKLPSVRMAYDYLSATMVGLARDPGLFDQPLPEGDDKALLINEIIAMFLLRYSTDA